MSISKLPKMESDNKDLDDFIKGAVDSKTPKSENDKIVDEFKNVKLRLKQSLLNKIDKAVGEREPKPSRHQWLLEAIFLKLEADKSDMKMML